MRKKVHQSSFLYQKILREMNFNEQGNRIKKNVMNLKQVRGEKN